MSGIQITSTTDTPENVTAAMGGQSQSEVPKGEAKSAPAEQAEQKDPAKSDAANEETDETEGNEDESGDDAADEAAAKADDDSAKDEKPRKKGGFQRRIDKLNAAKADALREAEYWKRKALEGAGEPKPEPKVETKQDAPSGKPSPDNYESHADYVEAVAAWAVAEDRKRTAEADQKSKLESEHKTALSSHYDRLESFKEKTPDFDEVVGDGRDIPYSPTVEQAIITSENGPALLYALAKDREEFERICKLPPIAAARELGKFEAKLAASSESKKPEPKKTTQAPKPITPVGSKGVVQKSIYDAENLTQKEFNALMESRAKQRAASG